MTVAMKKVLTKEEYERRTEEMKDADVLQTEFYKLILLDPSADESFNEQIGTQEGITMKEYAKLERHELEDLPFAEEIAVISFWKADNEGLP